MILVTGATGINGREILARLARLGASATAMLRQSGDASGIPDGIGRVAGDFDDEQSLDRALAGVERAFLLTPSTEHAEAQQERFVAAAARAGVRHIVKLSHFRGGRGIPRPLPSLPCGVGDGDPPDGHELDIPAAEPLHAGTAALRGYDPAEEHVRRPDRLRTSQRGRCPGHRRRGCCCAD